MLSKDFFKTLQSPYDSKFTGVAAKQSLENRTPSEAFKNVPLSHGSLKCKFQ